MHTLLKLCHRRRYRGISYYVQNLLRGSTVDRYPGLGVRPTSLVIGGADGSWAVAIALDHCGASNYDIVGSNLVPPMIPGNDNRHTSGPSIRND